MLIVNTKIAVLNKRQSQNDYKTMHIIKYDNINNVVSLLKRWKLNTLE